MKRPPYRFFIFHKNFVASPLLLVFRVLKLNNFWVNFKVRLNGVATFIGIVGLSVAVFVLAVLLVR